MNTYYIPGMLWSSIGRIQVVISSSSDLTVGRGIVLNLFYNISFFDIDLNANLYINPAETIIA